MYCNIMPFWLQVLIYGLHVVYWQQCVSAWGKWPNPLFEKIEFLIIPHFMFQHEQNGRNAASSSAAAVGESRHRHGSGGAAKSSRGGPEQSPGVRSSSNLPDLLPQDPPHRPGSRGAQGGVQGAQDKTTSDEVGDFFLWVWSLRLVISEQQNIIMIFL